MNLPELAPGDYQSADGKKQATIVRMHTCPDGSELAYVELPDGKKTWWLPEMFDGWRRYDKQHPWERFGWKVLP